MSMRIVQPHEASVGYFSGLSWQVLDAMGQSFFGHEEIPKLIENGAKFFAQYKNDAETNIGVAKEFPEIAASKKKLISLAVLIASVEKFSGKTCLVLLEDKTAVDPMGLAVGLVGGNVVIDTAFTPQEIGAVYEEFVHLCQKSGRSFIVCGDVCPEGVQISPANAIDFAAVVIEKKSKRVALAPLKNEKFTLSIIIVAIAMIISFASYEAWDWFRSREASQLSALMAQKNSPTNLYNTAVAELLAKPQIITAINGDAFVQEVSSFVAQSGGWQLKKITCAQSQCTARWKSIGGTYENFNQSKKAEWGKISLGGSDKDAFGDLQTLEHGFELRVEKKILPPVGQWPSAEAFAYEQGIDWQKLKDYGWQATLGALEQQAIGATISPAAVRDHPSAIYAMPWAVSNQSWSLGQKILPLLKKNTTLTHFELVFDDKGSDVTFNASGLSYVKK